MAIEAVIDASVFLALLLDEELTPNAERLFSGRLIMHVPELCDYEVAAVLAKQVRGKHLTGETAAGLYAVYEGFTPKYFEGLVSYSSEFFKLALQFSLSPYDQAYILLSLHLNIPLISADQRHIQHGAIPLADF